jgi:hypothetical protein
MRLLISEVLQKVSNAKTKAEKISLLQKHNSQTLRSILIWNFDESVESLIPEGEVPYRPNEAPSGTEHTLLEQESKRFYYFISSGRTDLPQLKRESMFIQMLEGLHRDEAEIMVLIKDHKLGTKYRITKATVQEAFPEIVWGNRGA